MSPDVSDGNNNLAAENYDVILKFLNSGCFTESTVTLILFWSLFTHSKLLLTEKLTFNNNFTLFHYFLTLL